MELLNSATGALALKIKDGAVWFAKHRMFALDDIASIEVRTEITGRVDARKGIIGWLIGGPLLGVFVGANSGTTRTLNLTTVGGRKYIIRCNNAEYEMLQVALSRQDATPVVRGTAPAWARGRYWFAAWLAVTLIAQLTFPQAAVTGIAMYLLQARVSRKFTDRIDD